MNYTINHRLHTGPQISSLKFSPTTTTRVALCPAFYSKDNRASGLPNCKFGFCNHIITGPFRFISFLDLQVLQPGFCCTVRRTPFPTLQANPTPQNPGASPIENYIVHCLHQRQLCSTFLVAQRVRELVLGWCCISSLRVTVRTEVRGGGRCLSRRTRESHTSGVLRSLFVCFVSDACCWWLGACLRAVPLG